MNLKQEEGFAIVIICNEFEKYDGLNLLHLRSEKPAQDVLFGVGKDTVQGKTSKY